MMTPFVDVIVVLWKSAPYLEALFDGLVTLEYPRDRVTIHFVDNGHGDGSLDEVQKQMARLEGKLPPIEIHEPGLNTGFSGGNNLAMKLSIERGHEYCYLLNHDASFEPNALTEAVAVAEQDPMIGSVQSLLVLQQHPNEVNSTGNAIQFLGFGYCDGYHDARSSVSTDVRSIAYASGAAVLYRNNALKTVGLLDEILWLYHEDLDLGWRLLVAGYRNMMAPASIVQHRYDFSRSIAKWYWMERNRGLVVLKNYRLATLVILALPLLVTDLAILLFAIMGGWWKEKLRAMGYFWKPTTWRYVIQGRREIARIRQLSDRRVLASFSAVIAYQEFESPLMTVLVNPLMRIAFAMIKMIARW